MTSYGTILVGIAALTCPLHGINHSSNFELYFPREIDNNICNYTLSVVSNSTQMRAVPIDLQSPPLLSSIKGALRSAFDRVSVDLDPEELAGAERAMNDALYLYSMLEHGHYPRSNVTDDGVALFQWQSRGRGLVLLFAGDGEVLLSRKQEGTSYSDDATAYNIDAPIADKISKYVSELYS